MIANVIFIPFHINDSVIKDFYDDNEEKYDWINNNSNSDTVIAATEFRHASYFTGLPVVSLPYNIGEERIYDYFKSYNVTYVLLEEFNKDKYRDDTVFSSLYHNYDIGMEISFVDFSYTK